MIKQIKEMEIRETRWVLKEGKGETFSEHLLTPLMNTPATTKVFGVLSHY